MSRSSNPSGGIGFCGLLAIVFITLKLCGVIAWSWWLVLLPILIPLGFIVGCLVFAGVCLLIAGFLRWRMTPEEREFADRADRMQALREKLTGR